MKKFKHDYGVFICKHVFKNKSSVDLVIRDSDGHWQFLCGKDSKKDLDECHLVGVEHLLKFDPTLEIMVELKPSEGAERSNSKYGWEFFELN